MKTKEEFYLELQEELDFDGHSHRSVFTEVNQESDQIMQEIRLNGQSDKLAWVAGLFYMKDEADRSDNFKTGIAAPFPPHQYGVFPPPPLPGAFRPRTSPPDCPFGAALPAAYAATSSGPRRSRR